MKAAFIESSGEGLSVGEIERPSVGPGDVLIKVEACGVCRTDLHLLDGEIPTPKLPLVPGHEIVGTVADLGSEVERFHPGDRVGVPWLGWTCGECEQCLAGRENLCARAIFTGQGRDGGYAEYAAADERYCLPIRSSLASAEFAPLLCAGLIGFRALRMAGEGARIGLYGFGAAAHIIAQVARQEGREIFAFTRPGNAGSQKFATAMGAVWAGDSDEQPPVPLDAAVIFAPAGELVPTALRAVRPGGCVVCAGIHMSEIPAMPYELLWGERTLRSVANLTRRDGEEFMALVSRVPIRTRVREWPLEEAPAALDALRGGQIDGAQVLVP